jgi:hypothetical protein
MRSRVAGRWITTVAAVALVIGCGSNDPIGPNQLREIVTAPSTDKKVDQRAFRARNGKLYELDVSTAVLSSDGKARALPTEVAKQVQRLFERYATVDAKLVRFALESCYQEAVRAIELRGGPTRKFRLRASGQSAATPRLSATSPGARVIAPTSALTNASSQVCIETSEAIYNATEERNSLQLSIEDLAEELLDAMNWLDPTNRTG